MFFLLISKIIPPTSIVVPLISKYLLVVFILNILSVFNTCIVISLYFTELKLELIHPWVIIVFFKILPTLLFIKKPKMKKANKESIERLTTKKSLYQSTFSSQSYGNCSILTTNYSSGTLKLRSNLYNFDKFKQSFETDCEDTLKENYSKRLYSNSRRAKSNIVTLDNIEVTDSLISVSRSIQYISQLMKDKSEIDSVG